MIKLRQLISEATIACGECVSWAWKYYMTPGRHRDKKAKVVFGSVQNDWISNGKRYKHVWIVDKNKIVKDWQTMVGGSSKYGFKGMPMKFFKDTWHPKIDKEYGMEEAAEHYLRTKTMLGWKW